MRSVAEGWSNKGGGGLRPTEGEIALLILLDHDRTVPPASASTRSIANAVYHKTHILRREGLGYVKNGWNVQPGEKGESSQVPGALAPQQRPLGPGLRKNAAHEAFESTGVATAGCEQAVAAAEVQQEQQQQVRSNREPP